MASDVAYDKQSARLNSVSQIRWVEKERHMTWICGWWLVGAVLCVVDGDQRLSPSQNLL
jgi:hypothetical protein